MSAFAWFWKKPSKENRNNEYLKARWWILSSEWNEDIVQSKSKAAARFFWLRLYQHPALVISLSFSWKSLWPSQSICFCYCCSYSRISIHDFFYLQKSYVFATIPFIMVISLNWCNRRINYTHACAWNATYKYLYFIWWKTKQNNKHFVVYVSFVLHRAQCAHQQSIAHCLLSRYFYQFLFLICYYVSSPWL